MARVIIAPDSFKGCLTAREAALSIGRGFKAAGFETDLMPMADGGEGFVETMVHACGGNVETVIVEGPLGKPVEALYGVLPDGTLVIETASASGLTLMGLHMAPTEELTHTVAASTEGFPAGNAGYASTYGTGQIIKHAIMRNSGKRRRIVIGLGGSATTDCGAGLLMAMGAMLTDKSGAEIARGGYGLLSLESIDLSESNALISGYEIIAACDVENPLYGTNGAAAVFAPQKGASKEQVEILDTALRHFDAVARRSVADENAALIPGAGAAGGLGYALNVCMGAKMQKGANLVLEVAGATERIKKCDWVITGEGRTDFQTAHGKAPAAVARLSKTLGVPVVLLSGAIAGGGDGFGALQSELDCIGIDAFFSIANGPITLDDAMRRADELLYTSAYNIANVIKRGMLK